MSTQACLAKGTRLALYDGSEVNVEDVKKGDLLLGPDGGPRKAFNIVSGKERLYRIKVGHSKEDLVVTANHILALHKTRQATNNSAGPSIDDQRQALEERFGQLPNLDSEPNNPAAAKNKMYDTPDFITALKKAIVWMIEVDRTDKGRSRLRNLLNGTTAILQSVGNYRVMVGTYAPDREYYTYAWGNPSRQNITGHASHPPVFYATQDEAFAVAVAKSRELHRSGRTTLYNLRERFLAKSANSNYGEMSIDEGLPCMKLRWNKNGRTPSIMVYNGWGKAKTSRSFRFPGFPDEDIEDIIGDYVEADVSPVDINEYVEMTAAEFAALDKGTRARYRLYQPPPFEYPEQDIPVDPYFLGLWLGDGSRRNTTIFNNHEQEIREFLAAYAAELDLHFVHHGGLSYAIVGRTKVGQRPMPDATAPHLHQKQRDEMVRRFTILGRRLESGWKVAPNEDGSGRSTWHAPSEIVATKIQSLLHDAQPMRAAYTTVKRPGNASPEQHRRQRHRSSSVNPDSETFHRSSSLPIRQNVGAAWEPEEDIYGATPERQLPVESEAVYEPRERDDSSSSLPSIRRLGVAARQQEDDIHGATPERQIPARPEVIPDSYDLDDSSSLHGATNERVLPDEREAIPNAEALKKKVVAFTSDFDLPQSHDQDEAPPSSPPVIDLTRSSTPLLPVVDHQRRTMVDLALDSSQPPPRQSQSQSQGSEFIPNDPLSELMSDHEFMSQIGGADVPIESEGESQLNQVIDMIAVDDDDDDEASELDDVQPEFELEDEDEDEDKAQVDVPARSAHQYRLRSGRRAYGILDHEEEEILAEQIMPAQGGRKSTVNTLLRAMDDLGVRYKGPKGPAGDTKHIPETYMKNTRAVRLAVLAGLIDSDGCYHLTPGGSGCFRISQSSKWHSRLFQDIVMLARSLGFTVTTEDYMSRPSELVKTSTPQSLARIYGEVKEIPTLLHRKIGLEKLLMPFRNHMIMSIELEEEETEWFGFRVDKDQLYLRHDHIVLHNSGFEESMVSIWTPSKSLS